jgi:hypothetical protein
MDYGPVFGPLVAVDRRRGLGAGKADEAARQKLEVLTVETAFGDATVVDREMAACCVAGVWLLHDFLDESHTISQGIETPSGSYWHAIMHRREGDFWNSKYWYRRMGRHPVLEKLSEAVSGLGYHPSLGETRPQIGDFDPMAFVDACEAAVKGRGDRERCLDVQQCEWELLFDFCYRAAVGMKA